MKRWVDDPWQDSCTATIKHGLECLMVATLCRLVGHNWSEIREAEWEGDDTWRDCGRCGLKQSLQLGR